MSGQGYSAEHRQPTLWQLQELAQPPGNDIWLIHDERSAFRWSRAGEAEQWNITGMVIYGTVTVEQLRAVRLPPGHSGEARLAYWYASAEPPSEERITDFIAAREHLRSLAKGMAAVALPDVKWMPRRDGVSADQFYRQVADVFNDLQPAHARNTTTALAELAGVPFTTAVHWVREARKRDYLPRSNRQQRRK